MANSGANTSGIIGQIEALLIEYGFVEDERSGEFRVFSFHTGFSALETRLMVLLHTQGTGWLYDLTNLNSTKSYKRPHSRLAA